MTDSNYVHNSHNVSNLVYHFVASVGKNRSEEVIRNYVKNQGKQDEYEQLIIKL